METIVICFDRYQNNKYGIAKSLNDVIGNNLERWGYPEFVAEKIISIAMDGDAIFAVVQVRESGIQA